MIRKILLIGVVGAVLLGSTAYGAGNRAPVVSNVIASQRGDGSNLVDIYYNLSDADGDACLVFVKISMDGGATWGVLASELSGAVGTSIAPGTGKRIVWDVGAGAPGLTGTNFKVRVIADDKQYLAEMAFVAAGTFDASTGDAVYLSHYWIDKYEVTNLFYCMFLNGGANDDYYHDSNAEIEREGAPGSYTYRPRAGYERRPARWVSWIDAKAFCDWRSVAEGLSVGTYHLPTEAQWEKAAGWDPVRQKFWKYAFQSDSISSTKANYNNNVGRTTDVGSYPYTSYYGCYDMSGNVWEWCADWYASDAYPTSNANPTGPATGTYRVLRGGAWSNYAATCETGYRTYSTPSYVGSYVGFRSARTLE